MAVRIRKVETGRDLKNFMRFPWKIYGQDQNWVPPLDFDVSHRLDRRGNFYFDHARAEYFLAEKDGNLAGRITAQVDDFYFEHWGEKVGHFGFFECIEDREVSAALFGAAADWLRKQGREKMHGPYNFTINDECGLLVDGFDTPPMFLMTHNPAYYRGLVESAGMKKAMDLLAYKTTVDTVPDPRIVKFAEALKQRHDIQVRNMSWKNFGQQMDWFVEIYNSAWEKNWGMVPITEKELRSHALELRLLASFWPELNFFALVQGKPIGMSVTLPNFNEVFRHLNGKILSPSAYRFLTHKIESCRVFALGVKEQWRRHGVGAIFYVETLTAARRIGMKWGEMSWILENNVPMRKAIEGMGGYVYKTYRIYELPL